MYIWISVQRRHNKINKSLLHFCCDFVHNKHVNNWSRVKCAYALQNVKWWMYVNLIISVKIFKIDLSVVMLTYGPPRTTPWQNICTQRVQSCQNNAFLFVQVSNTLLFLQCAKKKILNSLEYCCKCFAPKSSMCFIKMKLLHSEWRHRKISPRKLISARNGGNGLHHVSFRCMLSPSKLLFEHSHASFVFNIYTVTYSVCSKLLSVLDSSTTGGIVWKI